MTRTDAILAAIAEELERRRREIDADDGLHTVGVIVKLSDRTGKPSLVIYRPESQRRIESTCNPKRGMLVTS